MPENPLLKSLLRAALAIVAGGGGMMIGFVAGQALVYLIAELTDRDIAELKDMLIWGFISGSIVCGIASIWLVLVLTKAATWAKRTAFILLCIATLGGGSMLTASFDWPKSSGTPIVQYELRLPAGAPLPERDKIDLTVWSAKSGQGCYIAQIRMAGGRPEIAGDLTLYLSNTEPTMSLELKNGGIGHWRLPYRPDAALEKSFGPWQRIEFIPAPRPNIPPLPAGDYEIRYRVKKYM